MGLSPLAGQGQTHFSARNGPKKRRKSPACERLLDLTLPPDPNFTRRYPVHVSGKAVPPDGVDVPARRFPGWAVHGRDMREWDFPGIMNSAGIPSTEAFGGAASHAVQPPDRRSGRASPFGNWRIRGGAGQFQPGPHVGFGTSRFAFRRRAILPCLRRLPTIRDPGHEPGEVQMRILRRWGVRPVQEPWKTWKTLGVAGGDLRAPRRRNRLGGSGLGMR